MNFVLSRLHLPTHKASTILYCAIPFAVAYWHIIPNIAERLTNETTNAYYNVSANYSGHLQKMVEKERIMDRVVNHSWNRGVARRYPRWDGFDYSPKFWSYFMFLIGLSVLVSWVPPLGAIVLFFLMLAFGGISMEFYWQIREFADDDQSKPTFSRIDPKGGGPLVTLRKSIVDIITAFYERTFDPNLNRTNAVEYAWLEFMRDLRCCGVDKSLAHKEYRSTVCCPFKAPESSCSADEAYQPCFQSHPLGLAIFIGSMSTLTFVYLVAWLSSIIAWRGNCDCKSRSCLTTTIGCWLRKKYYTARKIRIFNVHNNF